MFGKLDQAKTREDFIAAAQLLASIEGGNERLGVVGFCYGGGMANFLATQLPQVVAAAPFYGSPPPLEDVAKIKAELLVVLAATDERINAAWPAYEEALTAAGVRYRCCSRRTRSTVSTTTPRRATTRLRRTTHGAERLALFEAHLARAAALKAQETGSWPPVGQATAPCRIRSTPR